ncbi:M3 family peptidase, partial [Aliarcobacter butzleri]|nr:M3 family peptidase [Aliarcobacter butzleri]
MSFKDFNLDNLENSKEILEKLLDEKRVLINELLNIENKTYKNFVLPFQEIGESINEFLTPIFHIDSVKNSEITTKVYEECLP